MGWPGSQGKLPSLPVAFLTIEYDSGVGSRPSLGVNAYAHFVFPPDHIAVSLHPGRACAEGLVDIDGERDAPVGISKWSQANLQYALHEAVRTGVKARGAGLFTDVDFSTTEGRATLPEASAVYTPSAAAKLFDNSKARSPLFADTVSSMLAFIRAAVVSRRNTNLA